MGKFYFKSYENYIETLKSLSDKEFIDFQKKLIPTSQPIIGVRMPIMRKLIKETDTECYSLILNENTNLYFEETVIAGLIATRLNEEESVENLLELLPYIDNWATCDLICGDIKFIKKNKEKYFSKIKSLALNNKEFYSRCGLVLLLKFYIDEKYLNDIFKICEECDNEKFYVSMAVAWLISAICVKFPNETYEFLKNDKLNNFIHNKAIQKIKESFRVSPELKERLSALKRK